MPRARKRVIRVVLRTHNADVRAWDVNAVFEMLRYDNGNVIGSGRIDSQSMYVEIVADNHTIDRWRSFGVTPEDKGEAPY